MGLDYALTGENARGTSTILGFAVIFTILSGIIVASGIEYSTTPRMTALLVISIVMHCATGAVCGIVIGILLDPRFVVRRNRQAYVGLFYDRTYLPACIFAMVYRPARIFAKMYHPARIFR